MLRRGLFLPNSATEIPPQNAAKLSVFIRKKRKPFDFRFSYPLRGSKVACNLTEGVSQSPLVAVREYDRGNPP